MSSHVYLLRHKSKSRFKIGKANDIIARARQIGLESIDFQRSVGLSVPTENEARYLERVLHLSFREARLDAQEVIMGGDSTNGASEWFEMSSWARVLQFLQDNHDLHPHELVTGDLLAILLHKIMQPTDSAVARAQRKLQVETQRRQREETRLAARKQQLEELEQSLRLIQPKLIQHLERHQREGNIVGIGYGFSECLVLSKSELPPNTDMLWGLDHSDTHYTFKGGSGSLIGGCMQCRNAGSTVCIVSLPLLTLDEESPFFEIDQVIHRVFAEQFEWLRQLPKVADDHMANFMTKMREGLHQAFGNN